MRTRSATAPRGDAQTRTPEMFPAPPIPKQPALKFYECECGLKPAFLENGVDDDVGVDAVFAREAPTEIDASAPEMQAVIAPEEPRGRGRRRVVQGGASDTAKSPLVAAANGLLAHTGRFETVPNEQADSLTVV